MLKIGTMSTHMNATCESAENMPVCTFEANIYGETVNNMTISGMNMNSLVKNIDVIKADFGAFIDAIAAQCDVVEEEIVEEAPVEEEFVEQA